jgi:hypothetical protein
LLQTPKIFAAQSELIEAYKTSDYIAEFRKLLIAVNDKKNKSKVHQFQYCFNAAYHYEKHYDDLYAKVPPNIPMLDRATSNMPECVKCFLTDLPDIIFEGKC